MRRPIYLDYNGTTPHAPEVIEAMRPYLETEFGNPSSGHWYGIAPKKAIMVARRQVAGLLGAEPTGILFTSGGTESNNQVIKSIAGAASRKGGHIITSSIEHPAILEVCSYMEQHGFSITVLPVDGDGLVDPADVSRAIRSDTVLISIMHANNEIGTIQPVAEISGIARENGILMHTDAAQSLGKIPVRVEALGVDLLSVAGHKIYAPKGVGALYIRNTAKAEVFCHGAGQEDGRRAGTENVMSIAGLGRACELAVGSLAVFAETMQQTRDRLEKGVLDSIPDTRVNGHREKRLPNTSSISFKGIEANRLLEEIGLDVAASAGAACHSDRVDISHVLQAIGLPEEWAKGTLRFTTGRFTTTEEIDRALPVIVTAAERLRRL
jgi:cysteine desulfurase